MKKLIKKSVAIVLCILMLSASFVSNAAIVDKTGKQHQDYGSYVLLGDSIAAGWSDITEDTEGCIFKRVEGSYGAYVADDLGLTDSYSPMACIGFRTVELRYIFEEDFPADKYLYYSVDDDKMDNVYAPAMIEAVKNAGLITLNIGGNDWGSFLGWHVFDELEKANKDSKVIPELKKFLEEGNYGMETIDTMVTIAECCGALPELIKILPKALDKGLTGYFENWNHVIEDIYALNPDVTLVVLGMFDNSIQSEEDLEADISNDTAAQLKRTLGQTVCDIANIPMIEGAEKYGYIYVDTTGTVCQEYHPANVNVENGSDKGHRYIADLILEALPAANFPFLDVSKETYPVEYNAIATVYQKGIMTGTKEVYFSPDKILTEKELYSALSKITDTEMSSDSDKSVIKIVLAKELVSATQGGIINKLKAFIFAVKLCMDMDGTSFAAKVTRAQAAKIFVDYMNAV